MSTPTNDGGPAFPLQEHGDSRSVPGMSLRDYFAAKATEEDIKRHTDYFIHGDGIKTYGETKHRTREEAKFAYADAMIAARNQTTK